MPAGDQVGSDKATAKASLLGADAMAALQHELADDEGGPGAPDGPGARLNLVIPR